MRCGDFVRQFASGRVWQGAQLEMKTFAEMAGANPGWIAGLQQCQRHVQFFRFDAGFEQLEHLCQRLAQIAIGIECFGKDACEC